MIDLLVDDVTANKLTHHLQQDLLTVKVEVEGCSLGQC